MRDDGHHRANVLELAILGLLKDHEFHGYELKKRLTDLLSLSKGVSFGSLYPALARLEARGALKAVEALGPPAAIPHTGSLGGEFAAFRARSGVARGSRGKKVYGITPEGEARFEELLTLDNRTADDDRLFGLRLTFARHLPTAGRLGLLERRRVELVERRTRLGARIRAGRDRLDTYARSLIEHDRETTERDISWVERLIGSERRLPDSPVSDPPDGAVGSASSMEVQQL
ncbi:MAG TPA: PadR family transcriptional regulator [Acidimicrobiales bacterium]|jgi:DNA-binding PadR family transcriptional regulator|nr:PadR family transcriptional regulator [Acidimicrobiales bacterium]